MTGTNKIAAQLDYTDEQLNSIDQNTQGITSDVNSTGSFVVRKSRNCTTKFCANIERSWKAGRAPLRYFYTSPHHVDLNDAGQPIHDVVIETAFGQPLCTDEASSNKVINRVTTAITIDNVYKNLFAMGPERLSRDACSKEMFGPPAPIPRPEHRIPEKTRT